MFLCLLDHVGQVPSTTIFHEDIKNASFAINVAVVVAHDVVMVEIFEDVSGTRNKSGRRSMIFVDRHTLRLLFVFCPVRSFFQN